MRIYTPTPVDASIAPAILLDISDCADAQGRELRIVFSVYETTGSPANTGCSLGYDAGGWMSATDSINDLNSTPSNVFSPSNGGAVNTVQWGFVFPGDGGNVVLIRLSHGNADGTYNYDFVVECLDGASWRALDGTGIVYSMLDDTFALTYASTDPVGDGFLVVEGGDEPPEPTCFWTDVQTARQVCE